MTSEITDFMANLRSAWQAGDLETYVAAFTPDADLVSRAGRWYRGRATIGQQLGELARSGRPALFTADRRTEQIRLITPTVAIVHESWTEPDRIAHATYVLARTAEDWQITATNVVLRQP